MKAVLADYRAQLPPVAVSRCPFCTTVLSQAMDLWGPDGYAWQERLFSKEHQTPRGCEHFGVLQGALHIGDLPPRGGAFADAKVGPEVPFVIPRLLQQPTVVAVVATVPLECGYTAYPIAYFTREKLAPDAFTQTWLQTTYGWQWEHGKYGWRVDTDPWDFELEPWVADRKLFWIDPGDPDLKMKSVADGPCPYVGLEGLRERQILLGDQRTTIPPPDGEEVDPFD